MYFSFAIYDIFIRSTSSYASIQPSCAKAKHNHRTENNTTHKHKKILKGTIPNIIRLTIQSFLGVPNFSIHLDRQYHQPCSPNNHQYVWPTVEISYTNYAQNEFQPLTNVYAQQILSKMQRNTKSYVTGAVVFHYYHFQHARTAINQRHFMGRLQDLLAILVLESRRHSCT